MIVQVPPPTTFDPQTQQQLRDAWRHAIDKTPGFDFLWGATIVIAVVVGLVALVFLVAVVAFVSAQWRRVRSEERAAGQAMP